MRKIVITMSIVLISLLGYSQVTNVGEFRIANATTAFGVNLPIGTKVYDIANNKYYVVTAGVASTATLTTASASFSLLNDAGTDDQNAIEVAVTAAGNLTSTDVQSALEELQGDIDGISDTDDQTAAEVNITDAGDNYTGTTVEAALAEIANAGYLTSEVDGSTTNEIQTLDVAQLNGTTLELSLSSDGEATKQIDLSSLQDGTGTDDQDASEVGVSASGNLSSTDVQSALVELQGDIDANASNISDNATAIAGITSNVSTQLSTGTVNGTTYGITSDGGTDDVVLAAATNSAAGVMTAAQVTKLEGIETGAQVNLTMITEKFEEDDGTATDHSLSHSASIAQGCRVSLNGSVLAPSDYTFTSSTITIEVPVYQYDQVVITYSY
ncbi:MAG: hypothetical protein JXP36_17475 [Bacteroidales bacterium]|nr:hypothetical protein [Bacteroidales bacterium]